MGNGKMNPLESARQVGRMIDDYYNGIKRAPSEGKQTCWHLGYPAFGPLVHAMDIVGLYGEGYGALLAARKQEVEPQRIAEEEGCSREMCSYSRSHLGLALAIQQSIYAGKPEPQWMFPKPDFVLSLNPCTTSANWFDALCRWLKVPGFHVELPFVWDDSKIDDLVAYTTHQLQDCVSFIEDVTHRPFNWEALVKVMAELKEAAILRKEAIMLCKSIPSPASMFDFATVLGVFSTLAGRPGTAELLRSIETEVEQRVEQKIGWVTNGSEKYRLYWDGIIVWNKIGAIARRLAQLNTCIIPVGRYNFLGFYQDPERIQPERPLESIAENAVRFQLNRRPEWIIDNVSQLCQEFSIDGMIAHAHKTCRMTALSQLEIMEGVSHKIGIPTTYFEADISDASFFSEAEFETKLRGLLEIIAVRKEIR